MSMEMSAFLIINFSLIINVSLFCFFGGTRISFSGRILMSGFLGLVNEILLCNFFEFNMEIFLLSLGTYIMYCMCFFALLNLNISSLRIRIIKEIEHSGQNGLSKSELLAKYSSREILAVRMERLLKNGYIKVDDQYYYFNSKLIKCLNYLINKLRNLFMIDCK